MASVFYDYLISIHDLHIEFDRLNIPVPTRNELMRLADSTVHHEIFDLLMIELPKDSQGKFLTMFANDPSDSGLMTLLKERSPQIEDKIKERIEVVKKDLLKELQKV